MQLGWIESLESKIEEQAAVADKPKPPPKPKPAASAKYIFIYLFFVTNAQNGAL